MSYAFYERPNFYSACVYLSESSACLLVLSNLAFLCFVGFVYGLQRLLFGPLRAIEIEQLYERGWIAATEWLFAMSIFRDEFGVWYLVMFLVLFMGKVWGWIAEGRIETLEQQTPANARLFHARLVASLAVFIFFAFEMFHYCLEEVIIEAKPGVMIMFVFEFAILCVGAASTSLKYVLWAYEHSIIRKQLQERLEERRRDAAAAAASQGAGEDVDPVQPLDDDEELDIHDLDLPGWEAKGTWQFALDIGTGKFYVY
jgi:E3 ubiquitin-protein ligase synoviolin